jgi:hypothetical protein
MSPPRRSRRCSRSGAFSGVGSRPLGGNRSSARCGLCSLMAAVDAEDVLEVAAAEDEDAVETVGAERSYPAFGVGICVRRPDRCSDHFYALGAEDLVEGVREFRVAVVYEESEGVLIAELHDEVARLLGCPAPVGIRGGGDVLDPSRRERDEEQHVDPLKKRGLDGEEVAGKHARRMRAQEHAPRRNGSAPVPAEDLLEAAPSAPKSQTQ